MENGQLFSLSFRVFRRRSLLFLGRRLISARSPLYQRRRNGPEDRRELQRVRRDGINRETTASKVFKSFRFFVPQVVRTPAKKSTAAGRSKPTAANGQRPAATVAAKTTGRPTAAPPKPETKKSQYTPPTG